MGIVGSTVLNSPILHCGGNRIGNTGIQLGTLIDGLTEGVVNIGIQPGLHHAVIKNQAAKIIRNSTHKICTPFYRTGEPEEMCKEEERQSKNSNTVKGVLRVRQENKKGKGV